MGDQNNPGTQTNEATDEAKCRRRYTLAELIAQCNPDAPMTPEEREWVDAPAVGGSYILDCTVSSALDVGALALGPSQETKPIPYGLVSLWDMINFNIYPLMNAWALIRREYSLASKSDSGAPGEARPSDSDQERLKDSLQTILEPLKALQIADDRLGAIAALIKRRGPYAELAHELKALSSDVMRAAQHERFYHYPREKGLLVQQVPEDWAATLKAFPSAAEDVMAAVDCYALGHNQASIYHCMAVLERGLPALAKRLSVKIKKARPTWKDMIDSIRAKVDVRRTNLQSPPKGSKPLSKRAAKNEHDLLGICGEAALEFRFFEHAWRNHIAHGRANYDENDAKKVLEHVKAFMELIAAKLNLKEI